MRRNEILGITFGIFCLVGLLLIPMRGAQQDPAQGTTSAATTATIVAQTAALRAALPRVGAVALALTAPETVTSATSDITLTWHVENPGLLPVAEVAITVPVPPQTTLGAITKGSVVFPLGIITPGEIRDVSLVLHMTLGVQAVALPVSATLSGGGQTMKTVVTSVTTLLSEQKLQEDAVADLASIVPTVVAALGAR